MARSKKPNCDPAPGRGKGKCSPVGSGVVYARYSSHAQKDLSIEQQVAKAYAYAAELNIPIVEVYADRAISGRTDNRPDFQRMMKDALSGQFRYVIAWKSNRMGRNMLEAMQNEELLTSYGIRILYTEENFDDTAAGRFAARSMMNVNQFYSEAMAEDIKRGLRDNALNCKTTNGNLPLGYKSDADLKYVISEPEAAIVREIFTRVANGVAFATIAEDLNQRGIKTGAGKAWGKGSFSHMVTNERYRGVYIYDDIRIEGGIPRIISDDLFFRVQEVLKTKKNPQGLGPRAYGDYLLTGKLFCGRCGSPMVGVSGTSKTGTLHRYYACQHHLKKQCAKKNVRQEDIESAVAEAITRYALTDEMIELIADQTIDYNKRKLENSDVGLLEVQLKDTQKALENIMKAIEAGIITDTTKERLLSLEADKKSIQGKIASAKAEIVTISREDLISGLSAFRDGNIKSRQFRARLFDTFLVAVYLYDDDLKIVFSFSGDKNSATFKLKSDTVSKDAIDNLDSCSHAVKLAPPNSAHTNSDASIYMFDGLVVVAVQFPLGK